jgi:hypothetical protein
MAYVSLSTLFATTFNKHRVFVIPDDGGGLVSNARTNFILDAKVNKVSLSLNDSISTVEIEFPTKKFGDHIAFVTPVAVFVDNATNIVFRGFMIVENGNISDQDDIMSATIYEYKWFLGKTGKIRGKIYTTDNGYFPRTHSDTSRNLSTESLWEKFRYMAPGGSNRVWDQAPSLLPLEGTGFFGECKTIFNEDNNPDCAVPELLNSFYPSFIFDPEQRFAEQNKIDRTQKPEKYWWNYGLILYYIYQYYMAAPFGNFYHSPVISMSMAGISKIFQFGQNNGKSIIIPRHFDITGLSPTQAIDKVVKAIPGNWFWRILVSSSYVRVDIDTTESINLFGNSSYGGKSLFLGRGGKINSSDNMTNVKSMSAKVSVQDAISHAVAVGGPLQIETSVEYLPAWPRYVVNRNPQTEEDERYEEYVGQTIPAGFSVCDFKNEEDFELWKKFVHNFLEKNGEIGNKLNISDADKERYSKIFRVFMIPENKYDLLRLGSDWDITPSVSALKGFINYLHEIIFDNVLKIRRIIGPATEYLPEEADQVKRAYLADSEKEQKKHKKSMRDRENPIFVFLYDSLMATTGYTEKQSDITDAFKKQIMDAKAFIVPTKDDNAERISYHFMSGNRFVIFDRPQFCRKTASVKNSDFVIKPKFADIETRKVFATLRLECDVPLILDKITRREFYGGMRLVNQEIKPELTCIFRYNAFFPTPTGGVPRNGIVLSYIPGTGSHKSGYLKPVLDPSSTFNDKKVRNEESKLYSANDGLDGEGTECQYLINDMDQLIKVVNVMIDSTPIYIEEYNVNLGKLDVSFIPGDRVIRVVNSYTGNPGSGYYNMNAVVEEVVHTRDKVDDSFVTTMTMKNSRRSFEQLEDWDGAKSRGRR